MSDIKTQAVAIELEDGGVAVMRIITEAPVKSFSFDVAVANGFSLSEDKTKWTRQLTDEMISKEIKKSDRQPGDEVPRQMKDNFARIKDTDIPNRNADRNAWTLRTGKIVVDPGRAQNARNDK